MVGTDEFVGRNAEARALLANVEMKRSTLVVGGPGVGKSALLRFLEPVLESMGTYLPATRVGPGFGGFLRELFEGLWAQTKLVGVEGAGLGKDLRADLKSWGKHCPSNDEKAKWIMERVGELGNVIVAIDDAHGVTPSNRPWLERLTEVATVVATVDPKALTKPGSKRFWKRFDEVRLEALSAGEAGELLDLLVKRYRVTADEPEIYRRRVLEIAQGNPFELERLVKHHSAEVLVKSRDLGHLGEDFVERDVKQVALAPLLAVGGALAIAGRYIARAQGDLDMYVLSGIGIAVFIVIMPLFRTAMRPRSRS